MIEYKSATAGKYYLEGMHHTLFTVDVEGGDAHAGEESCEEEGSCEEEETAVALKYTRVLTGTVSSSIRLGSKPSNKEVLIEGKHISPNVCKFAVKGILEKIMRTSQLKEGRL